MSQTPNTTLYLIEQNKVLSLLLDQCCVGSHNAATHLLSCKTGIPDILTQNQDRESYSG